MSGMPLRVVRYKRHEFLRLPRRIQGTLLTFVYDIPYFPPCGVFPPLHILNQELRSGGDSGGMSPGASWKPFEISQQEYVALCDAIRNTPVAEIAPQARYAELQFRFDSSFDHVQDAQEWMRLACEKHRESWHAALKQAGHLE